MKLNRTIKTKLKSDRGASLMLALLLFLACAVVGSIVLGAASASSGRMADIKEYDQRYYAVKSAAQLLVDELDGQQFELERTKKQVTTVTVNESTSTTSVADPTYPLVSIGFNQNSILGDAFIKLTGYDSTKVSTGADYRESFPSSKNFSTPTSFTLTNSFSDKSSVNIEETINPDGTIKFVVSTGAKAAANYYEMTINFSVELDDKTTTDTEYAVVSTGTNSSKETATTTSTRTLSAKWTFASIE